MRNRRKYDRQLERVVRALSDEPQTLDDLAASSGLTLAEVTGSLGIVLVTGHAVGDTSGPVVTYRRVDRG